MTIPNFDLLSESNKSLVTYVLNYLEYSQLNTTETTFQGFRTLQITEFTKLVSDFAVANPSEDPEDAVDLPELPSNPAQWTTSHVITAVEYFYGTDYSITEEDAAIVVGYLVEQFNNEGGEITWTKMQEALQVLSAGGDITLIVG